VRVHKLGHNVVTGTLPEDPAALKVLPDQRKIAEHQQSGQTLGRGMDFALVVLVFLGIGYGLDRWLGTRPLFMIGLVVLSVVGQFVKMYFEYTAQMRLHEAERLATIQSQPRHKMAISTDDLMVNDPVELKGEVAP
jgi:F0F1-type ATP synthase assembly protein I